MKNIFIIVIPAYNCEEWIQKGIESVRSQTYKNFKCCIIDDCSTDKTVEVVEKAIQGDDRFSLVVNEKRNYALHNFYYGFKNTSNHEEDILVTLDGDDWFNGDFVLERVNDTYEKTNCLMTYGSFVEYPSGITHSSLLEPYSYQVLENSSFRDVSWKASQLRTFKKKLWDRVKKEDLFDADTGTFYEVTYDLAMMFPMLEMAGDRSAHIKDLIYVYNKQNPISDMYVREQEQLQKAEEIKKKPRYSYWDNSDKLVVNDARKLLTALRFDLPAKTLYARHREKGVEEFFAKSVYEHHLEVWGGFTEKEPVKNNLDDFYEAYHTVLEDIKTNGFDTKKSSIPVDADHRLLNGSHRVAAAIHYKKPVVCKVSPPNAGQLSCTSEYFLYKKDIVPTGLRIDIADAMALEYAKLKKNIFVASLYQHTFKHLNEIVSVFFRHDASIVYAKDITLTEPGKINYIISAYSDETWIGNEDNGYPGAHNQANLNFSQGAAVKVVLFECHGLEQAAKIKSAIRQIVGVGKPSIHITDTQQQGWRNATIAFHEPTLNFINTSKMGAFNSSKIRQFSKEARQVIQNSDLELEDFCVGPAGESVTKKEIIYDPKSHFYLHGIKFTSLDIIDEHDGTVKPNNQESESVLFLWKNDQRVIDELKSVGQIKTIKTVRLSDRGKYNLLDQIHYGKPWWKINLIAEAEKRIQDNEFEVYVFTGKDLHEKIKKWKYETRNKLGIDKTYFHVSDPDCHKHLGQQCECLVSSDEYKAETARHINMIFHKNTFDFINQRTIRELPQFDKCLKLYHDWLPADHTSFCVDNGGVLGAHGIRDTHDLDFLCYDDDVQTNTPEFGCENKYHRLEYKRLGYSIKDIIDNPDNYFYHYGMKFMTLSILRKFKLNRALVVGEGQSQIREKDKNDCELINNFLKQNP